MLQRMFSFLVILLFLNTKVLIFTINTLNNLTSLDKMNNTIQLLENMLYEQAKQINKLVEINSGYYKCLKQF